MGTNGHGHSEGHGRQDAGAEDSEELSSHSEGTHTVSPEVITRPPHHGEGAADYA